MNLTNLITIIHPEGWRFIGIFGVITFLLSLISSFLGWIGFILTGWCFYFFRNPKRMTPEREGLVISPADGRVCLIKELVPPAELEMPSIPHMRISIFLNVFDVHVNRVPIGGKVKKIIYHPGRFFNASLDKASEFNERNSVVMDTPYGDVGFVQIAGLIARRIRCDLTDGEIVLTGSQYGIIRFGSRMDIYLPKETAPLVCVGQRVIAGETVIADFKSEEPTRTARCIDTLVV